MRRCNIVTFEKRSFKPKFRNSTSTFLCTNVLSVYQAQKYCVSSDFHCTHIILHNIIYTKVYKSFAGLNNFLLCKGQNQDEVENYAKKNQGSWIQREIQILNSNQNSGAAPLVGASSANLCIVNKDGSHFRKSKVS